MTPESGSSTGVLLIVATPIGNLGDISERGLEALRAADLVVSEDTRRAAKLLSAFGIGTPTESFHGDSSTGKRDAIVGRLLAGATVAYVTDAGTPTVSDPGAELVSAAVAAGVAVYPIPGPSAITAALSVSAINADRFVFLGYPPRKGAERHEFFRTVLASAHTVVLYEAPTRIACTLEDLSRIEPERECVVCRELTKRFEETLRGSVQTLAEHFVAAQPRGEFVVVIKGTGHEPATTEVDEGRVRQALGRMLAAGMPVRVCAEVVAGLTGLSRNDAYSIALEVREGATEHSPSDRPPHPPAPSPYPEGSSDLGDGANG